MSQTLSNVFFTLVTISFCLVGASNALASESEESKKITETTCLSSREFITTLEYLRTKKEFGLTEKQAQSKAHAVSRGCTGAAGRFISAVETLVNVEAGATFAVDIGEKLSHKTDAYSETFLGVFRNAYLKSKLDLDLFTSLKMAQSLSIDYQGDVKVALSDFLRLAKFCRSEKIQLSGPQCGIIAHQVVKNNQHSQTAVAESFETVFNFVQSTASLSAPIISALQISRDVVQTHPAAADNFIQAYRYGVSKKGLDLSAKSSLKFANSLAKRSWVDPKLAKKIPIRLPASRKKTKK